MSKIRPFFFTGARAKIKVNNKTLAYATNISYSVDVNHAAPTLLGMYEASSVEPLSYKVNGEFTIIRYVSGVPDANVINTADKETGNGIGNWKSFNTSASDPLKYATDSRTNESLNPGRLDQALGFDIEIWHDNVPAAKIRNARITRASFSVATDTLAQQVFAFTALYADEDSFLADFSGRGQQFD